MITAMQVVELLQRHPGKDQGLKAREMVELLTNQRSGPAMERRLRQLVELLRKQGFPICATPEHGYWWAETPEEIHHCIAWHRARSLHSLMIAGRLKKYGIPLLTGQQVLPIAEAMPQIPELPIDWRQSQTVSLEVDVPQSLHDAQQDFLRQHPDWDFERLMAAALALFLMQEGAADLGEVYQAILEEATVKTVSIEWVKAQLQQAVKEFAETSPESEYKILMRIGVALIDPIGERYLKRFCDRYPQATRQALRHKALEAAGLLLQEHGVKGA